MKRQDVGRSFFDLVTRVVKYPSELQLIADQREAGINGKFDKDLVKTGKMGKKHNQYNGHANLTSPYGIIASHTFHRGVLRKYKILIDGVIDHRRENTGNDRRQHNTERHMHMTEEELRQHKEEEEIHRR